MREHMISGLYSLTTSKQGLIWICTLGHKDTWRSGRVHRLHASHAIFISNQVMLGLTTGEKVSNGQALYLQGI